MTRFVLAVLSAQFSSTHDAEQSTDLSFTDFEVGHGLAEHVGVEDELHEVLRRLVERARRDLPLAAVECVQRRRLYRK